jgi:O-acetyl-ADP-ribose deacetylase (regulator of RNase III)
MKIVKGDLIQLAKAGQFDVIIHGCNCFNTMNTGLSSLIKQHFPEAYQEDCSTVIGDYNKLGYFSQSLWIGPEIVEDTAPHVLTIYNAYIAYELNASDESEIDYDALMLSLRTISSHLDLKDKIGVPLLGCGSAGGRPVRVIDIIENALIDYDVTIVEFEPVLKGVRNG